MLFFWIRKIRQHHQKFARFFLYINEEVNSIAQGIKLSIDNGLGGNVVLEAKTSELAAHYERDFGAIRLPGLANAAPRYLIADEAAKRNFFTYLK